MAILEVLSLGLKPNIQARDPAVLRTLSTVRSAIGTNSQFYQSIEDPSTLYILGEWPSLDAHKSFLASPERSQILAAQEDLFVFNWMLHLPFQGMSTLPLEAPVMAIARLFIKSSDDHPRLYEEMLEKWRYFIVDATAPWGVVDGWRCDAEFGKHESLMFTGWENVEAHDRFKDKTREENAEYKGIGEHYEGTEVVHARNLERL